MHRPLPTGVRISLVNPNSRGCIAAVMDSVLAAALTGRRLLDDEVVLGLEDVLDARLESLFGGDAGSIVLGATPEGAWRIELWARGASKLYEVTREGRISLVNPIDKKHECDSCRRDEHYGGYLPLFLYEGRKLCPNCLSAGHGLVVKVRFNKAATP